MHTCEPVYRRKYKTKWDMANVLGFLRRKNIYDLWEYRFECIEGQYYLTILSKRIGDGHYKITLCAMSDNTTVFEVSGNSFLGAVYDTDMDKFFAQKLDASPLKDDVPKV